MGTLKEFLADPQTKINFPCITGTNIVAGPGKFEGEPIYVPYFCNLGLDGFTEESGDGWDAFYLDSEDKSALPDEFDEDDEVCIVYYRDDGFVTSELSTYKKFEKWRDAQESDEA